MLHTEGGWPKEINARDVDLVDRTKKKMQKEETYLETVPIMAKVNIHVYLVSIVIIKIICYKPNMQLLNLYLFLRDVKAKYFVNLMIAGSRTLG